MAWWLAAASGLLPVLPCLRYSGGQPSSCRFSLATAALNWIQCHCNLYTIIWSEGSYVWMLPVLNSTSRSSQRLIVWCGSAQNHRMGVLYGLENCQRVVLAVTDL